MILNRAVFAGFSLAAALFCGNVQSAEPTEGEAERAVRQYAEKKPAQIKADCLAKAATDEDRATCEFIFKALTFDQATPEQRKERYRLDREECLKQARARGSAEMSAERCEAVHEHRMTEFAAPAARAAFFKKHRDACEAKAGADKARCAKIKPRDN